MEYIVDLPNKLINSDIFAQENPGLSLFMRDNKLIVAGAESQEEAQSLLDAHTVKEPTIDEKLASVGLSIEELKAALG